MRTRIVFLTAFLLASVQTLADSKTERHWHPAQVREIQRAPNHEDARRDHWEYVIVSDALLYTLRNGANDSPYLNSSLGAQVKIASVGGSDKPYDSDDVYVLDANGQEHRMGLISVVVTDDGCKK
jgi:hypothetical protein